MNVYPTYLAGGTMKYLMIFILMSFFVLANGDWVFSGAGGSYVTGPDDVPLGIGSAELDGNVYFGKGLNVPFSQVSELRYYSYLQSGNNLTLQLEVDPLCDGNPEVMIFDPRLTPELGLVTDEMWQEWDTLNGRWYLEGQDPSFAFELMKQYPDMCITSIVFVSIETRGNVDALTLDGETYDFEPRTIPEFGVIGAGLVLAGAALYRKKFMEVKK